MFVFNEFVTSKDTLLFYIYLRDGYSDKGRSTGGVLGTSQQDRVGEKKKEKRKQRHKRCETKMY